MRQFLLVWIVLFSANLAGCTGQTASPKEVAGGTPSATACSGCSTRPVASETIGLTPYQTSTPSPTPAGLPPVATSLPTLTPTPVTYTVKKDDDMFGISLRYGITLKALQTANPSVNPYWLSVGQVLVIPVTITPTPPDTPGLTTATPPTAGVQLGQPVCYPSADGGLWCLVNARNTGKEALETVLARIKVPGQAGGQPVEQTTSAPIDVLKPGKTFPLVAYFPAPAPKATTGEAAVVSVLPVNPANPRYLSAQVTVITSPIAEDGMSARVTGNVSLQSGDSPARQVWVAVLAYGRNGQPVGVRKWEEAAGLEPGDTLSFDITVYSLGPKIDRLDILAEAHR